MRGIYMMFMEAYGTELTDANARKLLKIARQYGDENTYNAAMIACNQYTDALNAFANIGGIALYSKYRSCSACSHCGDRNGSGTLTCMVDGWTISPEVAATCTMYAPMYSNCAR